MAYVLIAAVCTAMFISALCSLTEAALYAIPFPYVKQGAESGSRSAKLLLRFKKDFSRPAAALLVFNTIATTAGAAAAGWAAGEVLGEPWLIPFFALLTLVVLYCGEVVPKMAGVMYCRQAAPILAWPLLCFMTTAAPLIWITDKIMSGVATGLKRPALSPQEFLSLAAIGTQEGALDHFEGSVIKNVVGLDQTLVKEVLTPRVVVFRLSEDTRLRDIEGEIGTWNFSRVPLYPQNDPDFLSSYVTQRDIYRELLRGNRDKVLKEIARPLQTVPELMRADKLLLQMFEQREQLCAVADEHGGLAGIIAMEDIIEEIVGREIVDEYDTVSDLRSFAKILWGTKHRKTGR